MRSCSFSPSADCAWASWVRSSWSSERRSSFSPLALKVSSTQLTRSRAGFSARVVPSSQRPEDGCDRPLHRVQRAALPLRELGRQQNQGRDDQQHQERAAPSDLLPVHSAPPTAYPELIRPRRCEFLLIRWMVSNSSSERPEPTATQVSGDSVSCAGI